MWLGGASARLLTCRSHFPPLPPHSHSHKCTHSHNCAPSPVPSHATCSSSDRSSSRNSRCISPACIAGGSRGCSQHTSSRQNHQITPHSLSPVPCSSQCLAPPLLRLPVLLLLPSSPNGCSGVCAVRCSCRHMGLLPGAAASGSSGATAAAASERAGGHCAGERQAPAASRAAACGAGRRGSRCAATGRVARGKAAAT